MAVFNFTGGQVDMGSAWSGGTIQFYQIGTVTPKDTYTASDLVTINPNPVFLDSNGRAVVWLSGDYKVVFSHPSDSSQDYTVQNVNPETASVVYPISSDTTLTATHSDGTIEATGTITLTLSDAATLSAGWNVTVRNVGSGVVTIARETATDTMDGTAANITLIAEKAEEYQVISTESGFITVNDADELSSVLSTKGDIVYASAANTLARLAIGNDGQALVAGVGANSIPEYWAPIGYRSGLILSNDAGDTANDINITAGEVTDSGASYVLKLATEITKQIDNTWAAGDNGGGMFTGSVANDTWYHVFLIRKDSDGTIDAGFDTSIIAANIPAGYTAYERLGSVLTDATPEILNFLQFRDFFLLKSPILDYNSNITTTRQNVTLSTPLGVETKSNINYHIGQSNPNIYLAHPDTDDLLPSTTAAPLSTMFGAVGLFAHNVFIHGNTSSQIAIRATFTYTPFRIATVGWQELW